jgi:hypothetical protein
MSESPRDLSTWADEVLEDADCERCMKARNLLIQWRELRYGLQYWREL